MSDIQEKRGTILCNTNGSGTFSEVLAGILGHCMCDLWVRG